MGSGNLLTNEHSVSIIKIENIIKRFIFLNVSKKVSPAYKYIYSVMLSLILNFKLSQYRNPTVFTQFKYEINTKNALDLCSHSIIGVSLD